MQVEIVSIEGNIGSGKSTLLAALKRQFADCPNVIFLKEPVDEWESITDEDGNTMLAKFYADQQKYSFPFQIMAYISRLQVLRQAMRDCQATCQEQSRVIFITERSLYTDKMVFAKMLYDSRNIEHINHQIYLKWFDTFAQEYPVAKVIHVNTNPEICHERIHRRSRGGEQGIPLAYLQQCDHYHQRMLDPAEPDCVCTTQLILDGNQDIVAQPSLMEDWVKQINAFLGV